MNVKDKEIEAKIESPDKVKVIIPRMNEKVELPSGKVVTVYEMTAVEEGKLRRVDKLRTGAAMEELFVSCTEGVTKEDLLDWPLGDRVALQLAIRRLSYGEIYTFQTRCPGCGSTNYQEVNLAELQVVHYNPEAPREITLSRSGWKLKLRELTGRDEWKMLNLHRKAPEDVIALQLYLCVETVNGIPRDRVDLEEFRKLSAMDSREIRKAVKAFQCGVDTELIGTCSTCQTELVGNIPITVDFFYPDRL